ncbi:hypothetical protein [Saprospira grandis]|uniref:hypothetical protein n=1 Tax=Saprospira grandis TaxID=1008 RepID=UPI0022DD3CE8|nr:hypothetical protein [Saprospira grandis]WBM75971.1 hypothetical protein OP864_06965 [Saprospira grandis]
MLAWLTHNVLTLQPRLPSLKLQQLQKLAQNLRKLVPTKPLAKKATKKVVASLRLQLLLLPTQSLALRLQLANLAASQKLLLLLPLMVVRKAAQSLKKLALNLPLLVPREAKSLAVSLRPKLLLLPLLTKRPKLPKKAKLLC